MNLENLNIENLNIENLKIENLKIENLNIEEISRGIVMCSYKGEIDETDINNPYLIAKQKILLNKKIIFELHKYQEDILKTNVMEDILNLFSGKILTDLILFLLKIGFSDTLILKYIYSDFRKDIAYKVINNFLLCKTKIPKDVVNYMFINFIE